MHVEHDDIRATQDRDWSEALLEVVLSSASTDEDRALATHTLAFVDDPRLHQRLRDIMGDRSQPDHARLAAWEITSFGSASLTAGELNDFWVRGDQLLASRVLTQMFDLDIVLPIAADPDHALHSAAIDALAFGCDAHLSLAVAALSHRRADVRLAGTRSVLWDEPVAAIEPLIACLDDTDDHVRAQADETLAYFYNRHVLRALHDHDSGSFQDVQYEFARAVEAQPALAHWMAPVWDLVESAVEHVVPVLPGDGTDEATPMVTAATPTSSPREVVAITDEALVDALSNLGGQWADRRELLAQHVDWTAVVDRSTVRTVMMHHIDPEVRGSAAAALGAWGDGDSLLSLTFDANVNVAKAAIWHIGQLPSNRALAPRLRALLDVRPPGTGWRETLSAYVRHEDPVVAEAFLVETMHGTDSESKRLSCLNHLVHQRNLDAVRGALIFVQQPPLVTWSVHETLVEACLDLDIALPPLPPLDSIDDLRLANVVVRAATSSRGA
jgi:hypothetical protein